MTMIHIKVPSNADGVPLDPEAFAYDINSKQWKHKLSIAKEVIERYTRSVVTKDTLVPLGVPLLQEKGFVTNDVERAMFLRRGEIGGEMASKESMDDDEPSKTESLQEASQEASEAIGSAKTGKRGRQSKYPYKTMGIGESFLIDADSVGVTLNHSLLGDRAFQIEVVGGRFKVTRTK